MDYLIFFSVGCAFLALGAVIGFLLAGPMPWLPGKKNKEETHEK